MMKYYVDNNGEVFAYRDDGSQDHLIGNKTLVTKEQAEEISKDDHRNFLLSITKTYAERRNVFYPAIGDQLDALWHAMDDGRLPRIPEFYDPIAAVKQEYPKP